MGPNEGQLLTRVAVRVAELRREIELLEARPAGANEPAVLALKGRLAELEALLAGDADWRARVQERKARVVGAASEFMARRRGR